MKESSTFDAVVLGALSLIGMAAVFQAGSKLGVWSGYDDILIFSSLSWSAIVIVLISLFAFFRERYRTHRQLTDMKITLERRLAQHTDDLESANRKLREELEQVTRVNQELASAHAVAAAANSAKSRFLVNMSHEIRTPMNAILGYTELLNDRYLTPGDRDHAIKTIHKNGDHLIDIVNDIIDLTKIESGQMTLERAPCSPQVIVAQVASLMRAEAGNKGLTMSVEYRGPIPKTIQTDPRRLRQILINLVSNGIKFTQKGGVRLLVMTDSQESAGRSDICFEIIDTGVGMTRSQQVRVFEAFSKTDESTTQQFGGTGLGLMISKRLAELLDGDIILRSAVDMGSTFTVRIPVGSLQGVEMIEDPEEIDLGDESRDPSSTAAITLSGRVLLAEDGRDNQWLISYILRNAGAEVIAVGNGHAACEYALRAQMDSNPFDVILMDMQMPVLDGFSATTKLRTNGYTRPIVALTAHAMKGDRQRCLTAGCDEYMGKPTQKNTLLKMMAKYIAAQPAEAGTTG